MQCLCSLTAFLLNLAVTCIPHRRHSLIGYGGQRSLCSWVSQDCDNQRDSFWQTTTSRALHRQQTKIQPQSFSVRSPFVCTRPEADVQDRFVIPLNVTKVISRNIDKEKLFLCSPTFTKTTVPSIKEPIYKYEALFFQLSTQEALSDLLI